uniref:Uncharacterized protein n=1 Tax=Picea glauca TaxID=3330 RepID=A0A117NG52_PICGL|nr:hypothetical protein ABT39_MTgene1757 [Picea glauca]
MRVKAMTRVQAITSTRNHEYKLLSPSSCTCHHESKPSLVQAQEIYSLIFNKLPSFSLRP